jgi:hypothetical protein
MKSYITIIIATLSIIWVPVIVAEKLTRPQSILQKYPGLVRLEPGHTIVTDRGSATINPLSASVMLAENLNRELANNAFNNEVLSQRIKSTKPEKIHELLSQDQSIKFFNMLKSAQNKGVKWNPEAGQWGVFLLENDTPPNNYPVYGLVDLPGGREGSSFLVERNLNILLNWVKGKRTKSKLGTQRIGEENVTSLLKEVLSHKDSPISTQGAVEIYGLSKALNITYQPDLNLFLSPESRIIIISDEFDQ